MRRLRRLSLFSLLFAVLATSGCGDDSPTGITAGTQMTVAEQVAIEAALAKVAETLDAAGGTDTLLADMTRIAARLVRLQGRQGEISLTGFPGSTGAQTMHAAAVQIVDATADPALRVQVVVGWEGLDVVEFTLDRALLMVAPTGEEATGSFPIPSGAVPGGGRFVDYTTDPPVLVRATGGTLNVLAAAFGGDCPGIQNTGTETCTTGRETVSATVDLDGGAQAAWTAAELPAFRLVSAWPPD